MTTTFSMARSATAVGAMRARDVDAVLAIQRQCHDAAKQESGASFLAKLASSPDTCFVARRGRGIVGYLVSVPAVAGGPLPLNSQTCSPPPASDALYLHDLAVEPRARGAGIAALLVDAYLAALRRTGLPFGTLTAVNDSAAYWQRHGFRPVATVGRGAEHLAGYGPDARYMELQVADDGAPSTGKR